MPEAMTEKRLDLLRRHRETLKKVNIVDTPSALALIVDFQDIVDELLREVKRLRKLVTVQRIVDLLPKCGRFVV